MNGERDGAGDAPRRLAAGSIAAVRRTASGSLVIQEAGTGRTIEDVRFVRCFPWSFPQEFIGVLDQDGREIALLDSLEELAPDVRAAIEEELRDKAFHPRVSRIVERKVEFGVASITAETDRGPVTFQVRSRDDVRMLAPNHLLLRDADGTTYEVADIEALDARSRKLLQEYT